MSDSLPSHGLQHARLPCPSPSPGACSNSCPSSRWDAIQPSHPLSPPSPPTFNLSQHQGLLKAQSWPLDCLEVLELCSVSQLCLTLCDPMDCSSSGFSVHGILQARILEWVAVPSSGGDLPDPEMEPTAPTLAGRLFTTEPPGKPWKSIKPSSHCDLKKRCTS